ncbi:MAG TPA: winged helix DNA-binding protein [Streptosporangiaceae bacterium]|jgi:RIO-like serine/threonine protein kinase
MPGTSDSPYVDAQALTDVDTYVYEAIATLETSGRPVPQAQIAAVADLDDQTMAKSLQTLTERGVLVRTEPGGEAAFELARRDWSAEARRPGR